MRTPDGPREHLDHARRYSHLMPGNEDEAAGLLDSYLERANTRARLAAVKSS
jgi:hypothetical protein